MTSLPPIVLLLKFSSWPEKSVVPSKGKGIRPVFELEQALLTSTKHGGKLLSRSLELDLKYEVIWKKCR